MTVCAFRGCCNNSANKNKSCGITFHTFPRDEVMKYQWVNAVRMQRGDPNWCSTKNSRICSEHFNPEKIYTTPTGVTRLSREAVPQFMTRTGVITQPASQDEQTLADQSIRIYCLTKKLEKLQESKTTYAKKNKALAKKVARLNKKCDHLYSILINIVHAGSMSGLEKMRINEIINNAINQPEPYFIDVEAVKDSDSSGSVTSDTDDSNFSVANVKNDVASEWDIHIDMNNDESMKSEVKAEPFEDFSIKKECDSEAEDVLVIEEIE